MFIAFSCLVVADSFVISWTVACQDPLPMGFLRQEYWSGLPFPSPGESSNPGIKSASPALRVDSLPLSYQVSPACSHAHMLFAIIKAYSICSYSRLQLHTHTHTHMYTNSVYRSVHGDFFLQPLPLKSSFSVHGHWDQLHIA